MMMTMITETNGVDSVGETRKDILHQRLNPRREAKQSVLEASQPDHRSSSSTTHKLLILDNNYNFFFYAKMSTTKQKRGKKGSNEYKIKEQLMVWRHGDVVVVEKNLKKKMKNVFKIT